MTYLFLVPFVTACLYWGGVIANAFLIKRRTGDAPSIRPKQNLDYVLWLAWAVMIGLWAASPWIVDPEDLFFTSRVLTALGGLILVAGFSGTWWCYIALGNAWAISVNEGQTNKLITTGPYRWARHPIYSLQWLIVLGSFLIVPSIPLLLSLVILTFAMQWKARYEEVALGRVFGEDYEAYSRTTGRFVPFRCC
tara:strand:- start:1936 stop:2517 length:582 start_codon:yes stop_codon:yes gene_type:complete